MDGLSLIKRVCKGIPLEVPIIVLSTQGRDEGFIFGAKILCHETYLGT
jgi:hypothetical protein